MKKYALLLMLFLPLLGGCVMATYSHQNGVETFELKTFLKSVDGLQASKGMGMFTLRIDKTHTQNPLDSMVDVLQLMEAYREFETQLLMVRPPLLPE